MISRETNQLQGYTMALDNWYEYEMVSEWLTYHIKPPLAITEVAQVLGPDLVQEEVGHVEMWSFLLHHGATVLGIVSRLSNHEKSWLQLTSVSVRKGDPSRWNSQLILIYQFRSTISCWRHSCLTITNHMGKWWSIRWFQSLLPIKHKETIWNNQLLEWK